MQHTTRDNWIMLSIGVSIVTASLVFVFLPQSRKLNAIRTQIAATEAHLAADTVKAGVVPELVRSIQQKRLRYQDFDRRMPQRKELAGFLREISGILASEELSNQLTEPGNPTRMQYYHTLPIIMKFQGTYLSLASLLERIDRMERLTRVQKLWIGKDRKGDALNIELQMNIYFTES